MNKQMILIGMCAAVISVAMADSGEDKGAKAEGTQFKANLQGTAATATPGPVPTPTSTDLPIQDYDAVINTFKASYKALGKPKMLLYINRNLVKDRGEMMTLAEGTVSTKTKGDPINEGGVNVQIGSNNSSKQDGGTVSGKGGEKLTTTSGAVRVFDGKDKGVTPVSELEARQIEELFQRPFFEGGGRFVDQKVAALALQTFASAEASFLTPPKTDKEKEEVESLRKSADMVIEVLARKKWISIPQVSGNDDWQERLELTATVINLKDGVKLAQVNSESLFGFNRRDGDKKERRMRRLTSSEIIEQVALKVMQQIEP